MRILSLFLFTFLLVAGSVSAQMKSDPVGTWAGPLTTDAGSGGLQIKLSHPEPSSTPSGKPRVTFASVFQLSTRNPPLSRNQLNGSCSNKLNQPQLV